MRFVDAQEINDALTFPSLIAAMETAHARAKIEIEDGYLGSEGAHYFVRHAVDRGRLMGSKLITSFPANLGGELPAVQSVCVVFDGTNGRPLAVLDGTALTTWRTAADSALGAKFLAVDDPQTLLVVGAGAISRWLVRAHCSVRPSLKRVLIWNRTAARAVDVAQSLSQEGIAAEAVRELDAAVPEADVITSCTRAHEPLVRGALLKTGAHLDLVGSYTPQTREADDACVRRALLFVDRRETALTGVGDIVQPIAHGVISERNIIGDLYDLAGGTVAGRRSPTDITVFKNAGGAHLDLMTAEVVLAQLGFLLAA